VATRGGGAGEEGEEEISGEVGGHFGKPRVLGF
jgi:hypothetical protein